MVEALHEDLSEQIVKAKCERRVMLLSMLMLQNVLKVGTERNRFSRKASTFIVSGIIVLIDNQKEKA